MKRSTRPYVVVYERDSDGWWVASVRGVRGCHTQGRSIEQARKRIREALSLFMKNAAAVDLVDEIQLPVEVQRKVKAYKDADQLAQQAQETKREVVRALASWASGRDTAQILGLSHQRVHQVAAAGGRKTARLRRATAAASR